MFKKYLSILFLFFSAQSMVADYGWVQDLLVEEDVAELFRRAAVAAAGESGQYRLQIDLTSCSLQDTDGFCRSFEVEPFRQRCLLEGLDNIALALQHTDAIGAWEASHGMPPIAAK